MGMAFRMLPLASFFAASNRGDEIPKTNISTRASKKSPLNLRWFSLNLPIA